MNKKAFSYLGWGFFALLSILWLRFVFLNLPTNVAFLNYAGLEKTSLSALLSVAFVPLFFIAFIGFLMETLRRSQDLFHYLKLNTHGNRIALENAEAASKSLIEMQKIGYTTQFFSLLPVVYEDFYDSLRRILKGTILSDAPRLDAKTDDLWALCRTFLVQVARDPAVLEDIRRNFKKHDEMAKEFMNFKFRYERLMKALKSYDRDQFIYQFMDEGSLGRVMGLLTKIHERAFPPVDYTQTPAPMEPAEIREESSLLAGLSIEVKK